MWCDLGFFPNSLGNQAAANLRPTRWYQVSCPRLFQVPCLGRRQVTLQENGFLAVCGADLGSEFTTDILLRQRSCRVRSRRPDRLAVIRHSPRLTDRPCPPLTRRAGMFYLFLLAVSMDLVDRPGHQPQRFTCTGFQVVLTGVDGTGPPTGGRPRRETAAGWRRAKSDESATARSALDKGRHACGSRVKQKQEQDRSYTSAQHLERRNP